MLLYDWRSIYRVTGGQARKIILAIKALSSEQPPLNHYDPIYHYYYKNLTGKSFLLNPKELIESDYFYKAKEIADYIGLASFRNYSYYATTGDASLDLLHSPVEQDIINKNRLLSIENGRVLFKFEEVIKEN